MSIEDIVRAWKSDEDSSEANVPVSPVSEELTDEELKEVAGGMTCPWTCPWTE